MRREAEALWAVSLAGHERLVAPGAHRVSDQRHLTGRQGPAQRRTIPGRACFARRAGETKERELGWLAYSSVADMSPDGRTLVFGAGEPGRGPLDSAPAVYLRGIDGSPAVRLGEGQPVRLSPDGRWVLAVGADRQKWFLLPTRAGMPRALPPGPIARLSGGAWQDNRHLVLWGREKGHRVRVYLQDVETGTIVAVTPEGVTPTPQGSLTPDGKAILAARTRDGKWSLYPLDGSEPRPLALLDQADLSLSSGAPMGACCT